MGDGRHKLATGLYGAFHAELHNKVTGARVGRVLIYVCIKCSHADPPPQPADWMGAPKPKAYRACPECSYAGYDTAPGL